MVIYIKELDKNDRLDFLEKYPKFIHEFVIKFIEISNNILVKRIDEDKQIYILPNINRKNVYKNIKKRIKKNTKKTKRKVEIVLSEKLHQYINEFDGLKIINGRKVYLEHLEEVLNKVLGEKPIEMQDIYILSNSYNYININVINKLALKVKTINIVTKDIRNFSILENLLFEKGILITITNNKKKSLKKAKLIVNLDFDNEQLRKYNVYRNACIINISENVIKNLHGFEGMIVNNIDIKVPAEKYDFLNLNNLIVGFRKIELYESLKTTNQNIEIDLLFGNNGKINEKERLNIQKILTK